MLQVTLLDINIVWLRQKKFRNSLTEYYVRCKNLAVELSLEGDSVAAQTGPQKKQSTIPATSLFYPADLLFWL